MPWKLMSPRCVPLLSIMMPTCTIFCLTCVVLMAPSRRINVWPTCKSFRSEREPQILGTRVDSCPRVRALHLLCILIVLIFLISVLGRFFCSWSLIRRYVLSWSSTLRCQYGIPPAKRPLRNCSMRKSICKCYLIRLQLTCASA